MLVILTAGHIELELMIVLPIRSVIILNISEEGDIFEKIFDF